MMSRTRFLASLILLAGLIALPIGAAQAQATIRLSQVTIRVWPEFDKPGVLVFLIGQVAGDTALPAEVKLTVPEGATVNAVAYIDNTNVLTDKVPSKVEGTNVSITTPNGNFHIEFYDPALKVNGKSRAYTYTWNQALPVDQITWEVQQPIGATNFKVDPPGGATINDVNGLPAYQLKSTGAAAGQPATISVAYDKADNTLSATPLAATQAAAALAATQSAPGAGAPAGSGDNTVLIALVAGLLIVVIVGAAITYWRGGFGGIGVRLADEEPPAEIEKKPRGRAAKKRGKKPAPGQRFCPQCGQPARPGDLFCRNCGTRLHG